MRDISENTTVVLSDPDDASIPTMHLTFGEFCRDNEWEGWEIAEMADGLRNAGEFLSGGGAMPFFKLAVAT